jgi:hypothetical protein
VTTERELQTERPDGEWLALTLPDGRLNPDAVGWCREPLRDTRLSAVPGVRSRAGRWGRTKRWEYWGVISPEHVVAITVSSLEYAAVHQVWVLDRRTETEIDQTALVPFGGGVELPVTLGEGSAHARAKGLDIAIDESAQGTRLQARTDRVHVDLVVPMPDGHERLAVVVPWSPTRFQYTVKDVARPVVGRISVDGRTHEISALDSWAVLDHGRGRWPYRITWNWGAGSGRVDGRVVGLQVGGRWTAGTGSTENAVVVDGRLHKISEELTWQYAVDNPRGLWRVSGERVQATLRPWHVRTARTQALVVASQTVQAFGDWSGWALDDTDRRVSLEGLVGWAEEARQRW